MADSKNQNLMTLITFVILLIGSLALGYFMIAPFIPYIILGGILAIMTAPLYVRIRSRLGHRLGAAAVIFLVIIIVSGPLSFFAVRVTQQGVHLGQVLSQRDAFSPHFIIDKLQSIPFAHYFMGDASDVETKVNSTLQSAGQSLSEFLLAQATNIPELLLHAVITLITCFFFLTDGKRFIGWFADKIPLDQDVRLKLMTSFKNTSVSVIWATLAAAASQAAVMLTAFLVLGVPEAFLAAGATFVLAWIPLVGCSPVWIAGAIYLWMNQSPGRAIALVLFGLGAGIVDNIVRPIVLRGQGNMHPVVSLIAIFGGIHMFGILGIFFGPIIAALVISLLQVWPDVGHRSGMSFGNTKDEAEIEHRL